MRVYHPLGIEHEARDIDKAIRLHTEVRRIARLIVDEFNDCGGHYEYTGSTSLVDHLRDAVDAVEGYEITGQ